MPIVNIEGINVNFPYDPYDVQSAYMGSVIKCLQQGYNAVLESPTGTGKTLSLLCSSLAWQETRKAQIQINQMRQDPENTKFTQIQSQLTSVAGSSWSINSVPKIIYTSRTHSQLSQAMGELKRTSYRHFKTAILGSRQQLCIHQKVLDEPNSSTKLHICHALLKNKQCVFHNNLEKSSQEEINRDNILDIEELVALGNKSKICPYYFARTLKNSADIIFMPYNYILDSKARRAQGIELEGSVIIFDEAHNIEGNCEDAASCELHSHDLAACIEAVTTAMNDLKEREEATCVDFGDSTPPAFNATELISMKTRLLELERQIADLQVNDVMLDGSSIFQLFAKAEMYPENVEKIFDLLERIIEHLSMSDARGLQRKGQALAKFSDVLKVIFNPDIPPKLLVEYSKRYYRVHVREEKKQQKSTFFTSTSSKSIRILSYWCFSPSLCLKSLEAQKVHSIIITSGTLSPLDTFASELQIPIHITLENPHVIGKDQVWAGVVSRGPDETPLNSSYDKRSDQFIDSLGRAVLNFCRIIPDGILVFFPSYSVMKICHDRWEGSGTWTAINQLKFALMEPTDKNEFQSALKQYADIIKDVKNPQGAIFFAVFRGKVSEGLDFADASGRAVIVAGIPFANVGDMRVQGKRKYLNEITSNKKSKGLNGQQWYFLQAVRAVNQAVGRIIRHKCDYGAILLCDERFNNKDTLNSMSSWLRPRIASYNQFGKVVKELKVFFNHAEKMFPASVRRQQRGSKLSISYESGHESGSAFVLSQPRFNLNSKKFNSSPETTIEADLTAVYQLNDSTKCVTPSPSFNGSCLDFLENSSISPALKLAVKKEETNSKTENQNKQSLPVAKRKKIVIKRKHEEMEPEIKPEIDQKVEEKRESLKNFFIKAKTNLSKTQFSQFTTNIRTMNLNTCQMSELVAKLSTAFLSKPTTKFLFYEFRTCVPSARRDEYDTAVKQIEKPVIA
uniref:Regulator of telomere elongation helicase 1 homolog n=1 Tax=Strigamia maritima TaxID=126957 RepID=T1JFC6_STRMM